MSAAAVLRLPLLPVDDGGDEEGDGGAGAIEKNVRSGVRSNSYEQKKRPMYGAVPSSAAASPRYAVRMRADKVLAPLLGASFVDVAVDADFAGAKIASSPRTSERTAARSVG